MYTILERYEFLWTFQTPKDTCFTFRWTQTLTRYVWYSFTYWGYHIFIIIHFKAFYLVLYIYFIYHSSLCVCVCICMCACGGSKLWGRIWPTSPFHLFIEVGTFNQTQRALMWLVLPSNLLWESSTHFGWNFSWSIKITPHWWGFWGSELWSSCLPINYFYTRHLSSLAIIILFIYLQRKRAYCKHARVCSDRNRK